MALEILNLADSDAVKTKSGDLTGSNNGGAILDAAGISRNIPTSQDLTGIELRIKSIFIKDNRTPSFGPFPGNANFYLLTIVSSDVPNQRATPVGITTFSRIGDDEALPTKDMLFYYQQDDEHAKTPNQLHIVASVIKSKKGLRKAGEILADLNTDKNYTNLVGKLTNLAASATNFVAVADIVRELGGIVGKYLGEVEDRPLATMMRSFSSIGGDWDKLGVNPISMPTKFVNFNFDLIVRNKGKETALAAALNLLPGEG